MQHPSLSELGIEHGFGLRGAAPTEVHRPQQVHGANVVTGLQCAQVPVPEADAVVSEQAGERVGVVTADCVPILIAVDGGRAVAAVHAGWRGLARGIIPAAVGALPGRAPRAIRAVIGPHIGPCCYEVDEPVLDALTEGFSASLAAASCATRAGHVRLDLDLLVRASLRASGLCPDAIDSVPDACTACHPDRFHSFRRDGSEAGRLVHFIAANSRG